MTSPIILPPISFTDGRLIHNGKSWEIIEPFLNGLRYENLHFSILLFQNLNVITDKEFFNWKDPEVFSFDLKNLDKYRFQLHIQTDAITIIPITNHPNNKEEHLLFFDFTKQFHLEEVIILDFSGKGEPAFLKAYFKIFDYSDDYYHIISLIKKKYFDNLNEYIEDCSEFSQIKYNLITDLREELLVKTKPVFLSISTPRKVIPKQDFIIKFAAHTLAAKENIARIFKEESPLSSSLFELSASKWAKGTKITVQLYSPNLSISNSCQDFIWNGDYNILRFDAKVPSGYTNNQQILYFNIIIENIIITTLRPEIQVVDKIDTLDNNYILNIKIPHSAFASYSKKDRREVLKRLRSLMISTGMDIFVDCLSIKPSEKWKDIIVEQIECKEIFLLFWSRNAMKSKWVDFEWRTALNLKSIDHIQPHPLESSEIAPPPIELSELQFGGMYEEFLHLKSDSVLKKISKRVLSFFK